MSPVKSVKTTISNIPATREHIWLKHFLNEPMRGCRDVRKSQESYGSQQKTIAI